MIWFQFMALTMLIVTATTGWVSNAERAMYLCTVLVIGAMHELKKTQHKTD